MTTPAPLVRRDNPTIAVVGTLECVHGAALVSGASLGEARRLELEYGVVLYVGEPAPCSADRGAPLAIARAHGCVWLNLDSGAAELDGLATYDWVEAGHAD